MSLKGSGIGGYCLSISGCPDVMIDGVKQQMPVDLSEHGAGGGSWTITLIKPDGSGGNAGSGGGGNCNNTSSGGSGGGGGGSSAASSSAASSASGSEKPAYVGVPINLGSMPDTSNAGTLKGEFNITGKNTTVENGETVETPDTEGVSLASIAMRSRFTDSFQTVENAEGELKQILVPQALIDLEETAQHEVTLSFYLPGDVEANGAGGFTILPDREPYVQHIVRNIDGDMTRIEILKVQGDAILTQQRFAYDEATDSVIETTGNSYTKVVETTDETAGTRTVTTTVCAYENGEIGDVLSREVDIYKTFPFGEKLIESIEDPDGANLRTTYTYYEDQYAWAPARYGELKHQISPDGSWTKYEYDYDGRNYRTYTPWKNTPATPDAASFSNCRVSETLYAQPINGSYTDKVASRTVHVLGQAVELTAYEYSTEQVDGYTLDVTTTKRGLTNPLISIDKSYHQNSPEHLSNRTHSSINTDGTATYYVYEQGTITNGVFTATNGSAGTDRRTTSTQGTTASPQGVANKTTRTVTLYDDGQQLSSTTRVYTGGTGYETISETLYQYDVFNNPVRTLNNGRITSEAIYNFERLKSSIDTYGAETIYLYDNNSRTIGTSRTGTNGQPDIVTSSTLDGLGRTVSTTTSAGTLSSTRFTNYDVVGRLVSTIDASGAVTGYAYDVANRITAVSLPGGSTQTSTSYLDGRNYSTTGTAVTPSYTDYEVDGSGNQITTTRTGAPASPRYSKSFRNSYGQTYRSERPSPSTDGDGLIATTRSYDAQGRLASETTTGVSTIHYTYDELGNQFTISREILGQPGQGYDSLAHARQYYENIDGAWHRVTERWLLDEQNQPTLSTKSATQLTGLPPIP